MVRGTVGFIPHGRKGNVGEVCPVVYQALYPRTIGASRGGAGGGAGRVGGLDGCPVQAVSPGLDPPGPPGPKEQGEVPYNGDDFILIV